MHPVLFHIPQFPAWVGCVVLGLLAGLFAWYARKDPQDKGSWWLAGACVVGAGALLAWKGLNGIVPAWPIRWFGILFVLGFLAAAKVFAVRNARLGLMNGDESFDFGLMVLLAGIAGARTFHVFQNASRFQGKPLDMLAITDGGLVWYGGLFASTLYAWYWLAKNKKSLWTVSDSLAIAVPLGHAVGRIGCFMAGCDYGKAVQGGKDALPWAVHFPYNPGTDGGTRNSIPEGIPVSDVDYESLVPGSQSYSRNPETLDWAPVHLHPSQLYLALFNVGTFALLFWIDRKATKGAFPGRIAAIYMMIYAVGRTVIEQWRGDAGRGLYFDKKVSTSQIVSVVALLVGILLYRGLRKRAAHAPRSS